jgi:hypothetical protein
LEREPDILRDKLPVRSGEVEFALQRAIVALMQRGSEIANQVIENDCVIDRQTPVICDFQFAITRLLITSH